MNTTSIIFHGDVEHAKRQIPYALHCAKVVDQNKSTLGIGVSIKEYDIPGESGFVRVESLSHITRVIIDTRGQAAATYGQKVLPPPEFDSLTSRLTWLPSGFVLTPRSPSIAPNGWGLPNTKDGLGTPGGPLKQVIINRFADNLYPDVQIKTIKADKAAQFTIEPAFYVDNYGGAFKYTTEALTDRGWTVIGNVITRVPDRPAGTIIGFNFSKVGAWLRAVKPVTLKDWAKNFISHTVKAGRLAIASAFSPVSQGWYCHRPETMPYISPGDTTDARTSYSSTELKTIFEVTNSLRAEIENLPLLYPPLRGWYTCIVQSTLYECRTTQTLAHDYIGYSEGYKLFFDRLRRSGAEDWYGSGENLHAQTPPVRDERETEIEYRTRVGLEIAVAWATSPAHYAAMIYDWGDPSDRGATAGFLEMSISGGSIEQAQPSPYTGSPEALPEPINGIIAGQVFRGRHRWVDVGNAIWQGELGSVSWDGAANPVAPERILDYRGYTQYRNDRSWVYVRGRSYRVVPELAVNESPVAFKYVIGGGLMSTPYVYSDEEKAYRDALSEPDKLVFDSMFQDHVFVTAVVIEAPFDREQPGVLYLKAGKLDTEPVTLASYTLPITAYESLRVTFSNNGRNAVTRICNAVEVPNEYLLWNQINFNITSEIDEGVVGFGTDLLFITFAVSVEYDNGKPILLGSTSLDDTVSVEIEIEQCDTVVEGDHRRNTFNQKVAANYRCWAAYDGNQLVYATNHIEATTKQTCVHSGSGDFQGAGDTFAFTADTSLLSGEVEIECKSTLWFPDASSLVHTDVSGSFNITEGFQLSFSHLDIIRPAANISARLDFSMRETPTVFRSTHKIDGSLWMSGVQQFKHEDLGEEYPDTYAQICHYGIDIAHIMPTWAFSSLAGSERFYRLYSPRGYKRTNLIIGTESTPLGVPIKPDVCKVTHKAMLHTTDYEDINMILDDRATRGLSLSPRVDENIGYYAIPATSVHYDGQFIQCAVLMFHYLETHIAAMDYKFNFFGPYYKGWPKQASPPEEQTAASLKVSYVVSSIDLAAVVSVGDLDDNILPVSVL